MLGRSNFLYLGGNTWRGARPVLPDKKFDLTQRINFHSKLFHQKLLKLSKISKITWQPTFFNYFHLLLIGTRRSFWCIAWPNSLYNLHVGSQNEIRDCSLIAKNRAFLVAMTTNIIFFIFFLSMLLGVDYAIILVYYTTYSMHSIARRSPKILKNDQKSHFFVTMVTRIFLLLFSI